MKTKLASLFLAALSSGLLFRFGTGLRPLWYLTWIAPIPLFLFARTNDAKRTYAASLLTALIWESGNFAYLQGILGPQRTVAVIAAKALLWPLLILAARRSLWTYPFLCVAIETLTELTSPAGSFNSLAYSQMDFLPAIQIASVLGTGGVTFLITLFSSAVALLLIHRRPFDLLLILPVALTLIWGTWRVAYAPEAPTTKVGLIGSRDKNPDTLLPLIDNLASRAAKIIVLPEKLLDHSDALEPYLLAAKQLRLFLLAGINFEGKENRALLIGPEGESVLYRKAHLVPGWEEGFRPGKAIALQQLPSALVGIAICKDMDFSGWARRYGEAGVQIMLVPAADFPGDAWLHSRISVLRGVENGYSVARAALDGNLTLSDRYGRLLAEAPSQSEPTLAAEVPLGSPTLYTEVGNTFGLACALIFIASFLPAARMLTRKA